MSFSVGGGVFPLTVLIEEEKSKKKSWRTVAAVLQATADFVFTQQTKNMADIVYSIYTH